MENALEALKMAFAVLVFVLAMSLGFMMITQARSTSDVVFTTTDKQDYVVGTTSISQGTGTSGVNDQGKAYNRVIGFDTIIPIIYRYAQENYGVTILDKNYKIVNIYDLTTENNVSTYWTNDGKIDTIWEHSRDYDHGDVEPTGIRTYIYEATGYYPTGHQKRNLFKDIYSIKQTETSSRHKSSNTMDYEYLQYS